MTEIQSSQPAHTPGPWSYRHEGQNEFGAEVWTLDAEEIGHSEIAETYTLENARLIAAAPELLEALKLAEPYVRAGGVLFHLGDDLEKVRAAIAKATGARA